MVLVWWITDDSPNFPQPSIPALDYRITGNFWREKFSEILEKNNDFWKYISSYSLFLYLEIGDSARFPTIYFRSVCEWLSSQKFYLPKISCYTVYCLYLYICVTNLDKSSALCNMGSWLVYSQQSSLCNLAGS